MSKAAAAGGDVGAIALQMLWPVIVCAAMLWLLGARIIGLDALALEVQARPPVAVVDVSRVTMAAAGAGRGGLPGPDASMQARAAADAVVEQLRAAGYVVLDARQVLGYPDEFEVVP